MGQLNCGHFPGRVWPASSAKLTPEWPSRVVATVKRSRGSCPRVRSPGGSKVEEVRGELPRNIEIWQPLADHEPVVYHDDMSEPSSDIGQIARRPTIYDVAAACGVAPSTVSRAFSRPGRVNAETAERIREVAVAMGYRTNPIARALHTGRTSLLAVIVADVTNPFFFELLRGAEEAAIKAGYTLLVADAQESVETERQALDRTLPMVDGVLLATSRMSDSSIRVAAKQRPTVVLNRSMSDVASVATDSSRGMKRAMEHLAELGHTSIAYLAGPDASWANGIRWQAMREAAHDLDLRVRRLGPFPPTQQGGHVAAAAFTATPATAAIAYNDLIAIGLMRELNNLGVRVPHDVSVVGFDNIFGADFCTPELTTVAAPLRRLGAVAVEILLDELSRTAPGRQRTRQGPFKTALFPAELVVRSSTAACIEL